MADLNGFNAEDHKPLDSFDPIPPNKYEAIITESERRTTSKGDGEYLKLTWQIISGEYEGRKVFDNVNLVNPNAQAVEIGHRQLATICRAVGKLRINDSAELHDTPCIIDVKIRPAKGDYSASNDIKGYESIGATGPAATHPQGPPQQQQRPAPQPSGGWKGGTTQPVGGGGKPPWAAKK